MESYQLLSPNHSDFVGTGSRTLLSEIGLRNLRSLSECLTKIVGIRNRIEFRNTRV